MFDGDEAEWQVWNKKRGFIAEEVAVVDHWMANHWWLDSEDPTKHRATPGRPHPDEDTDPSNYDMADTSPVDWDERAMISDLVSVVQNLEARLAALEA